MSDNKKFDDLKNRIRKQDEEQFKCKYCDKIFAIKC